MLKIFFNFGKFDFFGNLSVQTKNMACKTVYKNNVLDSDIADYLYNYLSQEGKWTEGKATVVFKIRKIRNILFS